MEAWQIALIVAGAVVLVLFALWLFLIAPRRISKKKIAPFLRPYAHRGLWGGAEAPENSLAAFERAAAAGFAIELDIQLSKDGEVMVFHDGTLARMCGREGLVSDYTAAELGAMTLGESEQHIPTLAEVLSTVAGRVPLLIELKGENFSTALVPVALRVLEGYEGLWCMESFNPLLLRAVRAQAPHAVRGLLVTDLIKDKNAGNKARNFALGAMLLNFLCRPNFIAWNQKYPHSAARFFATRVFGAASMCYTVKKEDDYRRHLKGGTYPIFDEFTPEQ